MITFPLRYFLVAALITISLALSACENDPVADTAINAEAGFSDVPVNIKVGEPAPGFATTNADGQAVTLAGYLADSHVMLVFYRGSWCPYCISHLDDIQALFPDLAKNNVQLLAISPDDAQDSQKTAKKFDQPYLFLTDSNLAISDLYGVRKDDKLPHPAVVLINQMGNVVWYYVGEDYKQRPSAAQLRQVIDQYL